MESEAYAYLGLTQEQFYELTPREYFNLLEGYRKRIDIEREENAIFILMQLRGKSLLASAKKDQEITIDDILGKKREARTVTKEQKETELKELEESLGKEVKPIGT